MGCIYLIRSDSRSYRSVFWVPISRFTHPSFRFHWRRFSVIGFFSFERWGFRSTRFRSWGGHFHQMLFHGLFFLCRFWGWPNWPKTWRKDFWWNSTLKLSEELGSVFELMFLITERKIHFVVWAFVDECSNLDACGHWFSKSNFLLCRKALFLCFQKECIILHNIASFFPSSYWSNSTLMLKRNRKFNFSFLMNFSQDWAFSNV